MVLVCNIEYGVAQDNHQFFVVAYENSGQRSIPRLDDDAVSGPLPKLCLRRPKWFRVVAYDQSRMLALFSSLLLFLSIAHAYTPWLGRVPAVAPHQDCFV